MLKINRNYYIFRMKNKVKIKNNCIAKLILKIVN